MQSVDLTVRLPESMQLPVPEPIDTDVVDREELLSWQIHEGEGSVCFLSIVAGNLDACRAVVDDLDTVCRYDFTAVDEGTFYVYAEMDVRRADRALLSAFNDRGVVLVPPVTYTNTATIHVTVLGTQNALSSVVEGFPDEVSVDVERVGEHRHRSGSLAGRLTRRQFEAIEVARATSAITLSPERRRSQRSQQHSIVPKVPPQHCFGTVSVYLWTPHSGDDAVHETYRDEM
jgi:hypothetical protein